MKLKQLLTITLATAALTVNAQSNVTCDYSNGSATLSNGIVKIKISSNGNASSLMYRNAIELLSSTGIYFDKTIKGPGNSSLGANTSKVVKQNSDYAEVLYTNNTGDVKWSLGYIVRKGVSGVYMYVIAEGTPTSSTCQVQEARVCTRTSTTFLQGYVDDSMRGQIPSVAEMEKVEANGTENAAYVQDATYRMPDGSYYTKYNWAQYVDQDSVHGLMENVGRLGIWNIPVAREWYPGGPMKQELTVHATGKSPITLQMLQGEHFGTSSAYFQNGQKKLYGPFFLYVNYDAKKNYETLIADAKREASEQQKQWPYEWFENELYPHDRATVSGRINVTTGQTCDSICVVLAEPDKDLFEQNTNYIFWTLTDSEGNFQIPHVRKGSYALRAFAKKGDVTDELQLKGVNVDDSELNLGTINWTPRCYEHKLLQIGQNNRLSDGYKMSDHIRGYALWEQVPASLTFTYGTSNEATDWYYAQCKNGTWTVKFDCPETYTGKAHLTISAAGVTNSPKLAIAMNGSSLATWSPSPNDASIYRSAILGGKHRLYTLDFDASKLRKGTNTLTLTMSGIGKNGGISYDCIKLEAGNAVTDGIFSVERGERREESARSYNLAGQRVRSDYHGIVIKNGRKVVAE